ncbi:MAG: glycerol-3-phosphate 1-O-acyltransferase PlsY [Woeseia sp.]|nr:glycerol-3-phosphate 1-O-acyltransferase PlsY [Woeseia sp.]
MGSLIVGKIRGGVDIRKLGSGNAGGTNALRTQGLAFALGVMVIDVGKGVLATWFVPGIDLPFVGASAEISREWLTLCCAAAAVIGHVWPMWHQFRGGKGAATLIGTLAILAPSILLPVVCIWIVVLVISGYVGLSTILAGVASPVLISVMQSPDAQPVFIYCTVMAMYLLFSHRSNIVRMFRGEETQFRRAMIFRRRTE